MPIALEVTVILALAAIAAGLVALYFQLRHTAQVLDACLLSTRKDLSQIAEDVHSSRLRMDPLATSLQTSLDELLPFVRVMGQVGGLAKDSNIRFHSALESAFLNLVGIIRGISTVLGLFKNKPIPHKPEQEKTIMSQENTSSPIGPMLLTFLAGAAVGAVLAALITPKSGPELRGDLKDLGRRAKREARSLAENACEAWDRLKESSILAAADLKRGIADSANDLKG